MNDSNLSTDAVVLLLLKPDAHTETFESIRKELDSIDINNLTPVEALMKLQAIKQKLN